MWHIFLRFSSLPAKNQKYYSHTPLYGHPINTDTSLLPRVRFAPGEKTLTFSSNFNPLNHTDTPSIRTLSFQCPYQRGLIVHTYIHTLLLPPQRSFSGTMSYYDYITLFIINNKANTNYNVKLITNYNALNLTKKYLQNYLKAGSLRNV